MEPVILAKKTLGSQPIVPKNLPNHCSRSMIGENRQLVTYEPVEFKK